MQVCVSKRTQVYPFTYEIRKGRNVQYTKELWIDRRENSKKSGVEFRAAGSGPY